MGVIESHSKAPQLFGVYFSFNIFLLIFFFALFSFFLKNTKPSNTRKKTGEPNEP
jgi:ABC-type microcin C transport system permease subunit YejE